SARSSAFASFSTRTWPALRAEHKRCPFDRPAGKSNGSQADNSFGSAQRRQALRAFPCEASGLRDPGGRVARRGGDLFVSYLALDLVPGPFRFLNVIFANARARSELFAWLIDALRITIWVLAAVTYVFALYLVLSCRSLSVRLGFSAFKITVVFF